MSQCFRGSCESFATKDLDCFSDLTDAGLYSYFLRFLCFIERQVVTNFKLFSARVPA